MSDIRKLVFFERGVETLTYFSHEMAASFRKMGYQIFFFDIQAEYADTKRLTRFLKSGETAVITFNFIGLSGEEFLLETESQSVFASRNIPVYCILVDHPLYYHKQLDETIPNLTVFCIDRQHISYMKRFYKGIPCHFLPLAGNFLMDGEEQVQTDFIPYENREYEVGFIANYVHLPAIEEHFTSQTQEYIDFYHEILNYLRLHPSEPLDPAMEHFIRREIPEVTERELMACFAGMLFLDMYNRTYFRGETVRTLVDNGVRVHVFGKGWENLKVKHPENLILNGRQLDSAECVKIIRNTKIALNTMPWFKDGAHDRIFTAMLNKAVSLTDSSIYLRERFCDGKDLAFYELEHLDVLPEQVLSMLGHPKKMKEIIEYSYERALKEDTWSNRAERLREFL